MRILLSLLVTLALGHVAHAYSSRLISSRTYDISVDVLKGGMHCDTDVQTVDSRMLVPGLSAYTTLYKDDSILHRDSYVDCPDFKKYVDAAKKIGNPVKARLQVDLYENRGSPGYGEGKCLGSIDEEIYLYLGPVLDSQIQWSGIASAFIGLPSQEECAR